MNLTKPSLTDNFSLPAWNGNSTTTENAINSYVLQENKSVYVATTGNDTVGDGTSGTPYATIQKAINSIPKNLNGFNAYIFIAAGTYTENVEIRGFSSGGIVLEATSAVAVTIVGNAIIIRNTYVFAYVFSTLTFQSSSGIPLTINNSNVRFDANTAISGNISNSGMLVDNGATVKIGNIVINNCNRAIEIARLGRFYATTLAGTGNNVGIYGTGGSLVSYNAKTISATTEKQIGSGAIITNLLTMS